jgi:membrane protein
VGLDVLVETYGAWRDDRCVRLGAGLAYYGLFALVPLLTLSVFIAGLVFSTQDIELFLAEQLALVAGQEVEVIAARLGSTIASSTTNLGIIGFIALVVSGSLLFVAFQDALNTIWGVPPTQGLRSGVRRRVLAFSFIFVIGGLLVAVLIVQTTVELLGDALPASGPLVAAATSLVATVLPVAALAVALTVSFVLLPRADVDRWGAALSAVLSAAVMWASAFGLSWYVGREATASVQGAAGSVVLLLTVIYAQAQIVLVGAELSKVLTRRAATDVAPGG